MQYSMHTDMGNKIIIFSVIAAVVLGTGYAIIQTRQTKPSAPKQASIPSDQKAQEESEVSTPTPTTQDRMPTSPSPDQKPLKTEVVKAFVSYAIVYTDDGFLPTSLQIKKGDNVTFENRSTKGMWPASAMHPSHKEYPTTGGCIGSTFDACKNISPGEEWSFKFDIAGTWKYHDHLNPSQYGSITVTPE